MSYFLRQNFVKATLLLAVFSLAITQGLVGAANLQSSPDIPERGINGKINYAEAEVKLVGNESVVFDTNVPPKRAELPIVLNVVPENDQQSQIKTQNGTSTQVITTVLPPLVKAIGPGETTSSGTSTNVGMIIGLVALGIVALGIIGLAIYHTAKTK